MTVGLDRLRAWSSTGGRTPTGAAAELGISADYLQKILRGDRSPSQAVMQEIFRVTGITASELMGQTEPPQPPPKPGQNTESIAATPCGGKGRR